MGQPNRCKNKNQIFISFLFGSSPPVVPKIFYLHIGPTLVRCKKQVFYSIHSLKMFYGQYDNQINSTRRILSRHATEYVNLIRREIGRGMTVNGW